MKVYPKIVFFTLIGFLLGTMSCGYSTKLQEDFEKIVELNKGGKLSLINVNGNVNIHSWDSSNVKIMAIKTVKANSHNAAKKLMEELQISINNDPNYIQIKTEHPRRQSRSTFWDIFSGGWNGDYSVEYELLVPENMILDINTTNGGIEITKVSGEINVHSTNGRLDLVELSGSVYGKTTNGGIDADVVAFSGNEKVVLHTTNGRIRVSLPADLNALISARTTNGNITTDFPIQFNQFSDKKVEGTIGNGGGQIELRTTNGSISIEQN